jgi:hypothetical protein
MALKCTYVPMLEKSENFNRLHENCELNPTHEKSKNLNRTHKMCKFKSYAKGANSNRTQKVII